MSGRSKWRQINSKNKFLNRGIHFEKAYLLQFRCAFRQRVNSWRSAFSGGVDLPPQWRVDVRLPAPARYQSQPGGCSLCHSVALS